MTPSAARTRRFAQLDVFSSRPLKGNPLAVVVDAEGLDDATMAAFARWTNLSETTFLLPPDAGAGADYRVRIFTPRGELPFAGHPTLGSCAAWLAAGGQPREAGQVVQQCGIGLVTVRQRTDGVLAFEAPPLRRSGPVEPQLRARCADALRLAPEAILDAAWVDNGPGWIGVRLASGEAVRALQPDFVAMAGLKLGVVGPQAAGADTAIEVRAFVPALGVPEDPVTGSLNAGLALWLQGEGRLPARYVAAQGQCLGRDGRVHVERDAQGRTWIGGAVCGLVEGSLSL